jgi:8-oxo-dGTP diphosphatase
VSSLNPALEDVRFCPRCGAEADVRFPRSIACASCGYGAYFNPKPVACSIPAAGDGRILLMRRATEPGRGRWTMPGGFVDLGESVEDAAVRECQEELAIAIELGDLVGVYSRAQDRIVVVVYGARALGKPHPTEEALEVRAFVPSEIPWEQLAFWSDERALRDYLGRTGDRTATAGASPPAR